MKSISKFMLLTLAASVLVTGSTFAEKGEGKGEGRGKKDPAKIFAKIDADDSGRITLEEFTTAHEERVAKMEEKRGDRERPEGARTPPPADEIFSRMDSNGDETVTLEEFEEHMKNRKAGKGKKGGKKKDKNNSDED